MSIYLPIPLEFFIKNQKFSYVAFAACQNYGGNSKLRSDNSKFETILLTIEISAMRAEAKVQTNSIRR